MRISSLLSLAVVALATTASAQTPFAGDDFDGGTQNGGLSGPSSVTFIPDLSGTVCNNGPCPGAFPSSPFDHFGVTSRASAFIPFDSLDDSTTVPTDTIGIVQSGKTDNFILIGDTVNGDNSGNVSAIWEFDITGRTGLGMSIDVGAVGDFDASDLFQFSYSIDGGPFQVALDFIVDQDEDPMFGLTDSGIPYAITLESGTANDRIDNPFWSQSEWQAVVGSVGGPPPGFDFHEGDTDENGFVDVDFALTGPPEEIRGYFESNSFGDFNNLQVEPLKDPLFVNPTAAPDATGNNLDSGTQIDNEIVTISAPIAGAGESLVIRFEGSANGSLEYVVFDNLAITEGGATAPNPGDFDASGEVDNDDLNLLLNNWGEPAANVDPAWVNNLSGNVDNNELNALLDNWGFGTGSAVPEPTAALLLVAGVAGLARRR
ncbi:MAG: PEP-CTERM sorting domain-containing protein [Planctomycetota bacterium]